MREVARCLHLIKPFISGAIPAGITSEVDIFWDRLRPGGGAYGDVGRAGTEGFAGQFHPGKASWRPR